MIYNRISNEKLKMKNRSENAVLLNAGVYLIKHIYTQKSITSFLFVSLFLLFNSCYSFKGTSIPTDVNTFYVATFENNAANIMPTLSQTFTESLKDKIRNESRLKYNDTEPDVEFFGEITKYQVTSEGRQANETNAFNRLTINVLVNFVNNKDETQNWNQNFLYFNDFEVDENLLDIEDRLITNINNQLVEDIFIRAFTNW